MVHRHQTRCTIVDDGDGDSDVVDDDNDYDEYDNNDSDTVADSNLLRKRPKKNPKWAD